MIILLTTEFFSRNFLRKEIRVDFFFKTYGMGITEPRILCNIQSEILGDLLMTQLLLILKRWFF